MDDNQSEIVKALRDIGASVLSLAAIGHGVPDLLVCRNSKLVLMEVKDGSKPPSARKLTPDEARWHAQWKGPVFVVNNVSEALAAVGAAVQ